MCAYLDSQVVQVVSQYVSSSCDSSLSLMVLSRAQPWFNVLHGTITHTVSDNTKLEYSTVQRVTSLWHFEDAVFVCRRGKWGVGAEGDGDVALDTLLSTGQTILLIAPLTTKVLRKG